MNSSIPPSRVTSRFSYNPDTAGLIVACILIGIGVARIVSTYQVFCQTFDEPAHIARGEQWLNGVPYTYPLHPPLAPIMFAIGPLLSGIEIAPTGDRWTDGNAIIYAADAHHSLALARMGNLVFFIGASFAVWGWCRQYYGSGCAIGAVYSLTMFPPILAHAGLATTDMAVTASLTMSIWMFLRWLDRCCFVDSVTLGVCLGLTLLSKLSSVVFVPACLVAVVVFYKRSEGRRTSVAIRLIHCGLLLLTMCIVVWSGYRYSIGSIHLDNGDLEEGTDLLDRIHGASDITRLLMEVPVPAPEFFRGIAVLVGKNDEGHSPYFMGSTSQQARLAFFPVVLSIKFPLSLAIAFVVGLFVILYRRPTRNSHIPLACSIVILFLAMTSRINLGVRHVLPLYPLFSICIGTGLSWLWQADSAQSETHEPQDKVRGVSTSVTRSCRRGLVVALLLWCLTESFTAHPDYLAYFNAFAGTNPERIVVGSDLDWGQDLNRLAEELHQRRIDHIYLAYFGTAEPSRHGLPNTDELRPNERVLGYVAISLSSLKREEGYSWLNEYQPVAKIGKSILLYNVIESIVREGDR